MLKASQIATAKQIEEVPLMILQIHLSSMVSKYTTTAMSEAKEDLEDAGDKMKSGAKKTGNKIEDAGEDAKDKVD